MLSIKTKLIELLSIYWIRPPTQDAIVTTRILKILNFGNPNRNLYLPRVDPGCGGRSKIYRKCVYITTVDGSEIRRSPVDMVIFPFFTWFYTSKRCLALGFLNHPSPSTFSQDTQRDAALQHWHKPSWRPGDAVPPVLKCLWYILRSWKISHPFKPAYIEKCIPTRLYIYMYIYIYI